MYDPALGRFNHIDPLADVNQESWNPYHFNYNNPIRFVDPTGLYSTAEWMEDNGVTDDDLINVYSANDSDDGGNGGGEDGGKNPYEYTAWAEKGLELWDDFVNSVNNQSIESALSMSDIPYLVGAVALGASTIENTLPDVWQFVPEKGVTYFEHKGVINHVGGHHSALRIRNIIDPKYVRGARIIGKRLSFVGMGMSVLQFASNPTDLNQGLQSTSDLAFGAAGIWGGPIGAAFSGFYFLNQAAEEYIPAYKAWNDGQRRAIQDSKRANPNPAVSGICFVGGTDISSKTRLIKIENINIGDQVYSYNVKSDKNELKSVKHLLHSKADHFYIIQLPDEVLRVTGEHPFFVESKGWIKVKNLEVGSLLKTFHGGNIPILGIKRVEEQIAVYNFEVMENNNYYVGSSRVLVHNKEITVLEE